MLALSRVVDVFDEAHAHSTMSTDGFKFRQRFGITVDRVLQFSTGVTDGFSVDENGRDACVDHRDLQRANARHIEIIDQIAGGEHRAARFCVTRVFFGCRVYKFKLDFGGGEGHAIEFKVASLLHLAIGDGNM